jgi:hypothetical protein
MGLFLGLDLGQSQDYTALCVLQTVPAPPIEVVNPYTGSVTHTASPVPPALHIRHLERFPLGTRYPKIVQAVGDRLRTLTTVHGRPVLIVDKTGVGAPVVDLFVEAGLEPVAITITAGGEPHSVPGGYNVSKRDLVAAVQATLQTSRLKFAEALPDVATLTQELVNFQYKITAKANDTYEGRAGAHDDLVLCVALALWYAEKAYSPPWSSDALGALAGQPV